MKETRDILQDLQSLSNLQDSQKTIVNDTPKNFTPLPPYLLNTLKKKEYDSLDEQYQLAIDLRLLGFRYAVISKKLTTAGHRATEGTLRTWFEKGGFCQEVFEDIKQKRTAELKRSITEANELLKEGAIDSITLLRRSVVRALEKDNEDDVTEREHSNAREFLDRGGFPKQTKTDINGKIESESLDKVSDGIRSILEFTKQTK